MHETYYILSHAFSCKTRDEACVIESFLLVDGADFAGACWLAALEACEWGGGFAPDERVGCFRHVVCTSV